MLIKDIEKYVEEVGGSKIEFEKILEEYTTYFNVPNHEQYKEKYKKTTPQSFYTSRTDDWMHPDCTCLFYQLPFREASIEEKEFETTHQKNCHYALKMLLLVGTFDGINDSYLYADPPYYIKPEEQYICKKILKKRTKIIDIEKNINELGGKKIEFKDLIENIDDYVYSREYEIYHKDAISRVQAMSEIEFVYYLSNKPLNNDINFLFYHIPLQKDTEIYALTGHRIFLPAAENSTRDNGVKEVLAVVGTNKNEHVDYFNIFFPFDMLEEKQKEIKEIILNGKE